MERTRRSLDEERARAVQAGRHHVFDPRKPWDHIWKEVISNVTWWYRNLEESCWAKKQSHSELLASGTSSSSRGPGKQHNVSTDGMFLTNRRNLTICRAFQEGSCGPTLPDNRCPKNASRVHQCALCLAVGHAALQCRQRASPSSMAPPRSRNKGSGKNKKGRGSSGSAANHTDGGQKP
eukprot:5085974-Amphidinium_carterae.1